MVIEFGISKEQLIKSKLKRFEEMKPKAYQESLEPWEEKEFDELYDWLKIHNK
jgi:hypothetical protein